MTYDVWRIAYCIRMLMIFPVYDVWRVTYCIMIVMIFPVYDVYYGHYNGLGLHIYLITLLRASVWCQFTGHDHLSHHTIEGFSLVSVHWSWPFISSHYWGLQSGVSSLVMTIYLITLLRASVWCQFTGYDHLSHHTIEGFSLVSVHWSWPFISSHYWGLQSGVSSLVMTIYLITLLRASVWCQFTGHAHLSHHTIEGFSLVSVHWSWPFISSHYWGLQSGVSSLVMTIYLITILRASVWCQFTGHDHLSQVMRYRALSKFASVSSLPW